MNKKTFLFMLTASLIATSCVNEEEVAVNADPQGNAITFSPAVGRQTRATETTITNLGDFGVVARALDDNGNFYTYLIGEAKENFVIAPEIAKRKEGSGGEGTTSGIWELDRQVTWPTGVKSLLFWAATVLQDNNKNETDVVGQGNSIVWPSDHPDGPYINFTAKRADRPENYDNAPDCKDGSQQQDLVVASTVQSAKTSHVNLHFSHALSQIEIKAIAGKGVEKKTHRVKIKGAWIVNAASKAELHSKINKEDPSDIKVDSEWKQADTKSVFGSYLENPVTLFDKEEAQTILGSNGSMMLIPQKVTAWDGNQDGDRKNYDDCTTTDSYILLYCRIELVHSGAVHTGGDGETDSNPGAIITEGTDKHVHQAFPVLAKDGKFDANAYGYTCVPVAIDWKPGKKYTYTLDICGANTGGGMYPPQIPEDVPSVTPVVPGDKQPGDNVLDDPISFTVTVGGWEEDKDWTGGDVEL